MFVLRTDRVRMEQIPATAEVSLSLPATSFKQFRSVLNQAILSTQATLNC